MIVHARFSAITRRYIYLIYPGKTPSTFHQAFTFRVPQELDWSAMQQTAQLLTGSMILQHLGVVSAKRKLLSGR